MAQHLPAQLWNDQNWVCEHHTHQKSQSEPLPKVSGQKVTGIVYPESPLQKLPGIAFAASTTPPKPRTTGKKRHRQSMTTSLCLKSYKLYQIVSP